MSKPTDAAISAARFEAPSEATPLTTRPAWIMLYCVAAVALAFVFVLHDAAYWPTPLPTVSIVALAFVFALASPFGTFETVGGLAEYASLAMPIAFAMLLVLDWHSFCFAIVLSEAFNLASDTIRRQNKNDLVHSRLQHRGANHRRWCGGHRASHLQTRLRLDPGWIVAFGRSGGRAHLRGHHMEVTQI